MSDFGEEILGRLPMTSSLRDKSNPAFKVIDNTLGEWLDQFDNEDWFSQFFLSDASNKYLDLHGQEYNVKRRIDECDEDYRARIVYETLGHLTVDFLLNVYPVKLYGFVKNFSVEDNTLTTDNSYLKSDGFIADADEDTQNILKKKFILDGGVTWL